MRQLKRSERARDRERKCETTQDNISRKVIFCQPINPNWKSFGLWGPIDFTGSERLRESTTQKSKLKIENACYNYSQSLFSPPISRLSLCTSKSSARLWLGLFRTVTLKTKREAEIETEEILEMEVQTFEWNCRKGANPEILKHLVYPSGFEIFTCDVRGN